MSFIARHRRGIFGWWPPFFKTEINDEGIVVTRIFRSARLMRWSEIQCLDLSGLAALDVSKSISQSRHFLIMVPDARRFFDGSSKNWYVAPNVFGLTQIRAEDASALREELEKKAHDHSIKLDVIVVDF